MQPSAGWKTFANTHRDGAAWRGDVNPDDHFNPKLIFGRSTNKQTNKQSPPPRLIESAGLRPRLFQPQLIECICTRLHNDRWVSPQLAFFMFSKNDKAGLCFLTSLSVFLFSLSAFLAPHFLKSEESKHSLSVDVCRQARDAFIPRRRRRRRGRIHLAGVTFSFSPAASFSDYTR